MMSITLQNIKDRMTRRLKDLHDVTDDMLFDMATDLNQFLYREIEAADPERLILTQNYSVSTSPTTSALPAGFRDIQQFGCGFFIQDGSGKDTTQKLTMTSFGSIYMGYYINGSNVVFTGINVSTTIVLRYIPVLSDISVLSGAFCVPDEFKELVLEGMVMLYYRMEEDPREGEADERFARALEQFLMTIKKAPRVYGFTSISHLY